MKNIFSIPAAVVWILCVGLSLAQVPGKGALLSDDSPLDVKADHHQIDRDSGIWTCDGNVHIANARHTLRADHVRVNSVTGEVEAKGHVEVNQPGLARWIGESIVYNYKTGEGLTGASVFQAGRISVRAAQGQRAADGRMLLSGVQATTCTNAPGHQHYFIASDRMTYVDSKYLSAQGGVVWLFGLPVAYWPYWYRNLDDQYGLQLRPGYTSDWGPFLLASYTYPLISEPGGGELDGRVRVDYRSLRGWAVGHTLNWNLNALGAGKFDLYYAADQDGPDRDPPFVLPASPLEDRSRVAFSHIAEPTPRDRVVVQGQVVSDEALLRDFFPSQHRQSVQPDNVASYTRREDSWAGGVTWSGPLNGFYDGVSREPEAWMNVMPRELLPGLYYESQTRAGYLLKQTEPQLFLRGAEYDTLRVDTAHRFSVPMTIGDAVQVVPRAGYRGTYYRDAWDMDDGQVRNLFEAGVETSMKVYGAFGDLRHVLEPYADYSYVPRPKDLENGEVYSFDRYDVAQEWRDQFGFDGLSAPREWNGVRTGVRNTFQQRSEQGLRTFLDADIYGACTLAETDDPAGWQMLGWDLAWTPSSKVRVDIEGEYDTRERELRRADARVQWLADRWRFSAGYLFRSEPPNPAADDPALRPYDRWLAPDDRASVFMTEAQRALNSIWTVGFNTHTDLRRTQLERIGGFVQYSLDCMAFQLRVAYKPPMTLDDGSEREADYKIALMAWLLSGRGDPARDDILGF
jgi:lipopolysaccharide assembly outer membrane protein LptD (OstA)